MLTRFFSSLCSAFHIARVVAGIKNTEAVNTVLCSSFNKLVYNIICIVAVTKKVLCTQKHHDFCVRHCSMKLAQTIPRIFIQEADTRVISCTTPAFYKFITDFINHWTSRQHICCCHTSCVKTLMSITNCKFRNSNFSHLFIPLYLRF